MRTRNARHCPECCRGDDNGTGRCCVGDCTFETTEARCSELGGLWETDAGCSGLIEFCCDPGITDPGGSANSGSDSLSIGWGSDLPEILSVPSFVVGHYTRTTTLSASLNNDPIDYKLQSTDGVWDAEGNRLKRNVPVYSIIGSGTGVWLRNGSLIPSVSQGTMSGSVITAGFLSILLLADVGDGTQWIAINPVANADGTTTVVISKAGGVHLGGIITGEIIERIDLDTAEFAFTSVELDGSSHVVTEEGHGGDSVINSGLGNCPYSRSRYCEGTLEVEILLGWGRVELHKDVGGVRNRNVVTYHDPITRSFSASGICAVNPWWWTLNGGRGANLFNDDGFITPNGPSFGLTDVPPPFVFGSTDYWNEADHFDLSWTESVDFQAGTLTTLDCEVGEPKPPCEMVWCCDGNGNCDRVPAGLCDGDSYATAGECDAACGMVWCCEGEDCEFVEETACAEENSYTTQSACQAECGIVWCCNSDGDCEEVLESECQGDSFETQRECLRNCGLIWCCDGNGNCDEVPVADCDEENTYESINGCLSNCGLIWCCDGNGDCNEVPVADCDEENRSATEGQCLASCGTVWCCDGDGGCEEVPASECAQPYQTQSECQQACSLVWCCDGNGNCDEVPENECPDINYVNQSECEQECGLIWCCDGDGNCDQVLEENCNGIPHATQVDCVAECGMVWCCDGNGDCEEVPRSNCDEENSYETQGECEQECGLVWCCDGDGNCEEVFAANCDGNSHETQAECLSFCVPDFVWCCDGDDCSEVLEEDCQGDSYETQEECESDCGPKKWVCDGNGNCDEVLASVGTDPGYPTEAQCVDACDPLVWQCVIGGCESFRTSESNPNNPTYDTFAECEAVCEEEDEDKCYNVSFLGYTRLIKVPSGGSGSATDFYGGLCGTSANVSATVTLTDLGSGELLFSFVSDFVNGGRFESGEITLTSGSGTAIFVSRGQFGGASPICNPVERTVTATEVDCPPEMAMSTTNQIGSNGNVFTFSEDDFNDPIV